MPNDTPQEVAPRRRPGRPRGSTPLAPVESVGVGEWTDEDRAHRDRLVELSPLRVEIARHELARRATEVRRICLALDARPDMLREELGARLAASKLYANLLDKLKITSQVKDDGDDLLSGF